MMRQKKSVKNTLEHVGLIKKSIENIEVSINTLIFRFG